MTRSEATDLLYLIRRLWHRTTEVAVDDVTAAMLVLADVDFQAAVAALTRLGEGASPGDFPPSLPAIAGEATRRRIVPPYHRPFVNELPEVSSNDDAAVRASFAEARQALRRQAS